MAERSDSRERQHVRDMLRLEIDRLVRQKPPPAGAFGVVNRMLDRLAAKRIFFQLGSWVVLGYGVFIGAGFGLGVLWWLSLMTDRFSRPIPSPVLVLGLAPAAYAGSRLLYLVERELGRRIGQARIALKGNAFYGGVLGALLYLVAAFGDDPRRLLFLLDCAAPPFALIYAFVKLGCITAGCCVGRVTDSRLAVTYTNAASKAVGHYRLKGVRLHPLQLYEAVFALSVAALLAVQPGRFFGTGYALGFFLVIFSIGRAILLRFRYYLPGERASTLVWSALHVVFVAAGALLIGRALLAPVAPWSGAAIASPPASPTVAIGTSLAIGVLAVALYGVRRRDAV